MPKPSSRKTSESPKDDCSSQPFAGEARLALENLQSAVLSVLESLETAPAKAPQIARAFGLDKTLAWKLHQVAYGSPGSAIAQFIPGEAGLAIFMNACLKQGVEKRRLKNLSEAIASYTGLIRRHGGDRGSVQMMLSGAGVPDRTQMTLRRSAFNASSFVVGIQAQTQIQTIFVAPGSNPEMLDVVTIKGFIGIRRLRQVAHFTLARPAVVDGLGRLMPEGVSERIRSADRMDDRAPEVPTGESNELAELGWMSEFSSHPAPVFSRNAGGNARIEYELEDGPVGNTAAFSCFFGEVLRNRLLRRGTPDAEQGLYGSSPRVPTRVAYLDVFSPVGLFPDALPQAAVYTENFGQEVLRGPRRERYRLPGDIPVDRLTGCPSAAATPDVPRYATLAQRVFEHMGWDPSVFILHRVRIEYPFTPSAIVMTHPLFV